MVEQVFFDGVSVVVPMSAQLPLCRPADYADLGASGLADQARTGRGIP
jgi:hypothetical protein